MGAISGGVGLDPAAGLQQRQWTRQKERRQDSNDSIPVFYSRFPHLLLLVIKWYCVLMKNTANR
jgi:hypothetical protein